MIMPRIIEIYEARLPENMRKGEGEGDDLEVRAFGGRTISVMGVKDGMQDVVRERLTGVSIDSEEDVLMILENIMW